MRKAVWAAVLVSAMVLSGCAKQTDDDPLVDTDGDGTPDTPKSQVKPPAPPPEPAMTFVLSDVGFNGPEPSVGVTSTGCAFFVALANVMRSCDLGATWQSLSHLLLPTSTSDPYLWVDPVTDRIFDIQMRGTQCTQIAWSDDDGENWFLNPHDCGTYPGNDHIKLATGPWTAAGYGMASAYTTDVYPNAVYFCHNIPGVYCYTSFDGGATFPVGAGVAGDTGASGGLHGAITTAPDGTVYVPPRLATPTLAMSKDNGMSWSIHTMGEDVGTPAPRKNSEVGTDTASNAYHVWTGGDGRVYMSRSFDSGLSWEQTSMAVSAPGVISTTFPHIDAGDPGRVAVAYLGSSDAAYLGTPDIDDNNWTGNPHYAPNNVTYHLWLSFTLDGTAAVPTWQHVRLTDDPVQVGSICLNSGDCRSDWGGSNRNLLDFNDLTLGPDGRIYIAYADGCTDNLNVPCASEAANWTAANSRDRRGYVAIQTSGPSLLASVGDIE